LLYVIKIVHGAPSLREKIKRKAHHFLSPRESEKTRFSKCDYAETIRATKFIFTAFLFSRKCCLRVKILSNSERWARQET